MTTAYDVDCLVIGAGVVGLAVARQLQLAGRKVILVEKEDRFGIGTSSRNSEVIHSGIYYAAGSLKARLCVRGKELLYEYCQQRGLPHQRIGKLIVAVDEAEVGMLEGYQAAAARNGVNDLRWQDADEIRALEPAVVAVRGLLSPGTGIIDSHRYMQSLLAEFEQEGGSFVRRAAVDGGSVTGRGIEIRLADVEQTRINARTVINSAGLHAPHVARSIEGMPVDSIPKAHYAIGHYFTFTCESPFHHLIYPIATAGGLGVHLTLDLAGRAKFGPDISWRDSIDYRFDLSRKSDFVKAIRSYFPGLQEDRLQPGYTGIRPKIWGSEKPNADFVIQTSDQHGVDGLINLFGIESPGLTASLAIAEEVAKRATRARKPKGHFVRHAADNPTTVWSMTHSFPGMAKGREDWVH